MYLSIELAKQYLRLDEDMIDEDELELLHLMVENAIQYIEDAVGTIPEDNSKALSKAKLIALVLVSDFYEHRELTKKVTEKTRYTVQSMLLQLQCLVGGLE